MTPSGENPTSDPSAQRTEPESQSGHASPSEKESRTPYAYGGQGKSVKETGRDWSAEDEPQNPAKLPRPEPAANTEKTTSAYPQASVGHRSPRKREDDNTTGDDNIARLLTLEK